MIEVCRRKAEITYYGLPAIRSMIGDGAIPKRNKLTINQEKPDALIVFLVRKKYDSAFHLATAKGIPVYSIDREN